MTARPGLKTWVERQTMQTIGYIIVAGAKILILARTKFYSRQLKLRATGKEGIHFEDEEIFLTSQPNTLAKLLKGEVVEM